MRLSIFRIRTLAVADTALLLVASAMFGMFFFASLYVQEVLGYSPLRAGLAFLPVSAGIMVGAGLAQQLIKRLGVRNVSITGITLATRDADADPAARPRQLCLKPAGRAAADEHRDGPHVRAHHAAGDQRRQAGGLRPGLRPVQHRPAGRRLARPGHPGLAGRRPDQQPAPRLRGRAPRRWRPGCPATTWPSWPPPSCSPPAPADDLWLRSSHGARSRWSSPMVSVAPQWPAGLSDAREARKWRTIPDDGGGAATAASRRRAQPPASARRRHGDVL